MNQDILFAIGVGGFTIFAYILMSLSLLLFFDQPNWTIKDNKKRKLPKRRQAVSFSQSFQYIPALGHGGDKFPGNFALYSSINMLVAGVIFGAVAYASRTGSNNLYWSSDELVNKHWARVFVEFLYPWTVQMVGEYYYHRLMHLPWFYRHIHKVHHAFKAPAVFTDFYMHPIESCYLLILASPSFLGFQLYGPFFVIYVFFLGGCGVVDHSGLDLKIPLVYSVKHHDIHHELTNYNYAFPFAFMDQLHGTAAFS